MEKDYIKWPDSTQRRIISATYDNEFNLPNAVGIIDGTHINLSQKPAIVAKFSGPVNVDIL